MGFLGELPEIEMALPALGAPEKHRDRCLLGLQGVHDALADAEARIHVIGLDRMLSSVLVLHGEPHVHQHLGHVAKIGPQALKLALISA